MIILSNKLPRLLSKISGMYITGVTIFGFIIIRPECAGDSQLINHESIHVAQYKETLFLGFFLIYGWDFFAGIFSGKSWSQAYESTRFEIEAYDNDGIYDYLETRKRFAWLRL